MKMTNKLFSFFGYVAFTNNLLKTLATVATLFIGFLVVVLPPQDEKCSIVDASNPEAIIFSCEQRQ